MNSKETIKRYIQEIKSTEIIKRDKIKRVSINHNFINGAFVEIIGNDEKEIYEVSFYDNSKNELIHRSNIKCGSWTRTSREYYTEWKIEVKTSSGEIIFKETINFNGKKVLISIDSSSIGDNVAWMPYINEFRKKHNCEVVASTFWNQLFEGQYPDVKLIKPGDAEKNLYAMYKIGCFYNPNLEPEQCNTIPLQKVPTNILGLEFKEVMTNISYNKKENARKNKYVTIAPHSTAQIKYWNNPTGWQETVDYLIKEGYDVVNTSREGCNLIGVVNLDDYSIDNILNTINHSEFFIGLSSGISWLAWSLRKKVVMIANFTSEEHEFQENCIRIVNKSVCHGCWNKKEHIFDKGDWNWCPVFKGTDRQFECSKSITGHMVISKIKLYLINKKFDWGCLHDLEKELTEEIFVNKVYEKVFEVNEGDIVLDIGASVGPFSYSIQNKNPCMIICLEPSDEVFKTLSENIKGDNIILINKGIGATEEFIDSEYIFGGSQKSMNVTTIQSLFKNYKINKVDFMKIDCEGGEYDVFTKENISFIKKRISKVSGEFHLRSPQLKEKFKCFINNVLTNFSSYKVFSLDGVDVTEKLYSEEFINYYNEVIIHLKIS